jgi:pyruvate dehydrogenase E2 component (dihydrolipoamide acetyltransferase)
MARAIVMPSYGMYTAEGILLRWLKPTGAEIVAGEVIAEIETDKATADLTAPETGMLHQVAAPGTQLQVESLVGYVLAPGEAAPADEIAEPVRPASVAPASLGAPTEGRPVASPNARRLAAELGVDLAELTGTGAGGRISEDDVRAAAEGRQP